MLKLLSIVAFFIANAFADFTQVNVQPAPLIEWNQVPTTYYTGQTINVTWSYNTFLPSDQVRVTYVGAGGTRTLTSTASALAGTFAMRLSESTNGLTTNVPVTCTLATNASSTMNSQELISIVQSRIQNIAVYDGTRLMVSGQSAVCDDRIFSVQWRGLGQAQFGTATLTMQSSGLGGGQFGTALANIPVVANMTTNFTCVRTLVPSTFRSYSFSISVAEPGQNTYTGSSSSFSLTQAPTPSNTPSTTPSSTRTPSITPSNTPSPSVTPSTSQSNTPTPSPTPSRTPSMTPSPSTTETARPSIDYAAIAERAASAANAQTAELAGSILGTLAGLLFIVGGYKYYTYQTLTKKRLLKQKMTMRNVQEMSAMYGLGGKEDEGASNPTIVMYSVNAPLPKSKKGFTPSSV
jgi:hypothetical protein